MPYEAPLEPWIAPPETVPTTLTAPETIEPDTVMAWVPLIAMSSVGSDAARADAPDSASATAQVTAPMHDADRLDMCVYLQSVGVCPYRGRPPAGGSSAAP